MKQEDLENGLKEIVGERANFNSFERLLYSRDLMPIPNIIRGLFQTVPDAIVKPNTVEEVSKVLLFCNDNQVPVVARGGGTGGLFGAVPKKGGVVLDLLNLSRVIEIDKASETVFTEAGITWWELDRQLQKQGLTLRSYPSSARSASVAGWIMGNGLGIGTLKYRPVSEQIVSAEMVFADGTIKEFNQPQDIEWIAGSEGILGILSKVSLKVRKLPSEISHHLNYFDDISNLFNFIEPLSKVSPTPYAIEIYDHKYLDLIKKSGHKVPEFSPKSGMVLVTFDAEKDMVAEGEKIIAGLISQFHGQELPGADEEWQQRFNMLRITRVVPTVIPGAVHVPLDKLNKFYFGTEKLKKRPIGLLGHVISNDDCVLMPLVATDERDTTEFVLALHTPWELSNLALSLGGKPGGGLGVWNAPFQNKVLSREKIEATKQKKKELDPNNIMNPEMWIDSPLFLQPQVFQAGMMAESLFDTFRPAKALKVPDYLEEFRVCNQCGYCAAYCPTKQNWVSSTPRGRILATKRILDKQSLNIEKIDPDYLNAVYECSMCGRCGVDCSAGIKSPALWRDLRNQLVKSGFERPNLKTLRDGIDQSHNIAVKPNDQRGKWASRVQLPFDMSQKRQADVIYFVGCVTSFYPMVQDIARSFIQVLNAAGVNFTIMGGDEWCCGYPFLVAGYQDEAIKTMKHNIETVKAIGAKTVVMTCPGCLRMWRDEYHEMTSENIPFDIAHSTSFMAELIQQGKLKFREMSDKVTYHDPCDLGRASGIYDEPRQIIKQIPGLDFVEFEENREYCVCCGSGGDYLVSNQEGSLGIAKRKVKESVDLGAKTLVTACPSCIRSITMAATSEKAPLSILDISQLVWRSLAK